MSGIRLPSSRVWLLAAPLALATCRGGGPEQKASPAAAPSASARPAEAPPRVVRLETRPDAIGSRIRATIDSSLELGVEFWQEGEKLGTSDSRRREEVTRTVEVLGLVGASPARVRVKYERYHLVEEHPDKPKRDEQLLVGRTFLLDATEGHVHVTAEDGKPVAPEEDEALQRLHPELGRDDPLIEAIGPAPIPVGRSVSLGDKLFRALLGSSNGDFKGGRATLKEIVTEGGQEAAVIVWTAELQTKEESGVEITWHVEGTAKVGIAPARTLWTSVRASLDASGRTRRDRLWITIAGAGRMKDERRYSYE